MTSTPTGTGFDEGPANEPGRMADGQTPERLGRYRLVKPISTGGMARVFEARRESLAGVSPRVAIKVILPDFAADGSFQQLFVNEARIGSQLQHQNLVGIQDFDREGDLFYLVMEFVDGITLRKVITLCRRQGLFIPVPIICEMAHQVCEGLHYAHTATAEDGTPLHLVHRDIKPSNIMLNAQGILKVLDFGVSKALFSRERAGAVRGTWGYMSPEQALAEPVGPQADVFDLATVIYELAVLAPMFPEKEPNEIRELLLKDEAARRAATLGGPHGELAPLLIRALQRDPAARYSSAQAFGRALTDLVPDPLIAREQLVDFFQALASAGGGQAGPGTRSWSTLSRSGQESSASGIRSSASSARSRPGSSDARSVPQPLPVRVGHTPPELDLEGPVTQPDAAPRFGIRFVGLVLALAVLGYAGYRVASGWILPAPAPRVSGEGASSLESVMAAEDGVPTPVVDRALTLVGVEEATVENPPTDTSPTATPRSPGATGVAAQPGGSTDAVRPSVPSTAPSPTSPSTGSSGASPWVTEEPASASQTRPAEPPPVASAPTAGATGTLTISSVPRAQVILDGIPVRWVPLFQHPLKAGSHTVTLVTEDGRRTTFKVDVKAGTETRRIWNFELGQWAD